MSRGQDDLAREALKRRKVLQEDAGGWVNEACQGGGLTRQCGNGEAGTVWGCG